jgi:hypothetical protein
MLPGLRVTSEVGGAVVDHVWTLDLPEGKVALFRLTGETGAELGLYVFNSFAQSVYSSSPIATSARPGAVQDVTVVLPAGRYFVNVNGRNTDRTYRFTLTTALYSDFTPPIIAARFAGGRNRFATPYVDIDPRAFDALSGVTHLRYGVGDSDWSSWLPYSGGLQRVPVPSEEGTYQIRIQARNGVELLSEIDRLEATIDRTSPLFSEIADVSRQLTYTTTPSLIYLFNEPMDPLSFANSIFLRNIYEPAIPTSCTYDNLRWTVRCVPATQLAFGQIYLVDFQGARDVAGNPVVNTKPQTLSVLRKTTILIEAESDVIRLGDSVAIRVTVAGIKAETNLALESRSTSANEWTAVAEMRVNKFGRAVRFVSPDSSKEYRVRFPGLLDLAPSASKTVSIGVAPVLRLERPRADAIIQSVGTNLKVTGLVSSTQTNVKMVVLRCNPAFGTCSVFTKIAVSPNQLGQIEAQWKTERGFWKLRFVAEAQEGLLRTSTRSIRITVQ